MLIEFNPISNIYSDLLENLYGIEPKDKVIYSFVPIKFLDNYFILTCSHELEGYLIDYRSEIKVKIFLEDKKDFIILNSVVSITECKFNDNEYKYESENEDNSNLFNPFNPFNSYDCFIDPISNLLLIKYKNEDLEYFSLNSDINIQTDLFEKNTQINIDYSWTSENLKKFMYNKNSFLDFYWENKYLNSPSIPYLVDNKNINDELVPNVGSSVLNLNKLIGIVSLITSDNILITPIISIKRMLKMILGNKLFNLNLDLFPISFNFKNELYKIEYSNGIIIGNDYYDNLINEKKKHDETIRHAGKLKKKNYNQDNSNQDNSLLECQESINKIILDNNSKIIFDNNTKISNDNFDNKNITNDSNINKIFANSTFKTLNEFKYLSGKNIVCCIDNYLINSDGYLIIKPNIYIPLKSYLWLFKNNLENIIKFRVLPNNVFNFDLIELNYKNIYITDNYIKKKINFLDFNLELENYYCGNSSFSLADIKYIKYRSIFIIELNEKILKILKPYASQKINRKFFNSVILNRYTDKNKKIIFGINFNDSKIVLKQIKDFNNFDALLEKNNTNKYLKRFIVNNF